MAQRFIDDEPLLLRSFALSDQQEARHLILRGLAEHFDTIDESRNPDLDDIAAFYSALGHHFVVAEVNGSVVGTGALVEESTGVGRLVRMSVRQDHRRQGIGRALLEHLLGLARQRGYRRLLVETNHDWYDALRLYQRHGFRPYALDEESVHMRLDLR